MSSPSSTISFVGGPAGPFSSYVRHGFIYCKYLDGTCLHCRIPPTHVGKPPGTGGEDDAVEIPDPVSTLDATIGEGSRFELSISRLAKSCDDDGR